MKKIVLSVFTLLVIGAASAQNKTANSNTYKNAIGVKVWDGGGVSFKHFFDSKNAGELIGYFWGHGARITGLYEIHGDIANAGGLKWYIGPGAHVGVYNSSYGDGAFFGVDGVLGLDYKLKKAPLNFSLDWQPSFEFGDNRGFAGGWGGLGIRYTF
ncbi:hypothetical protein [Ferruginibacter profundus]